MKNRDSLGDRMKAYEHINRTYLPKRMPVIIRLDGCHFHTFTRGFAKPFDEMLISTMRETALELCKAIEGVKLAYTQSDEITLLLTNNDTWETQPWFGNNIQKMTSVAASLATLHFNRIWGNKCEEHLSYHEAWSMFDSGYASKEEVETKEKLSNAYQKSLNNGATFDARVFVLPEDEVCNCLIWRQQDAIRNSIQMMGQAHFSHKELMNKSCEDVKHMLAEKNIKWESLPLHYQRGSCVKKELTEVKTIIDTAENTQNTISRMKWTIDDKIPLFWENRSYVDNLLRAKE